MRSFKYVAFFLFGCAVSQLSFGGDQQAQCYGVNTLLYSNADTELSICHGEYWKVKASDFVKWHECVDAMILIKNKKRNKVSEYADCSPTGTKQMMLQGSVLKIRHLYVEYPSNQEKPLLIESIDLDSGSKRYEFLKKFPFCSSADISNAVKAIDFEGAKPFNGDTFFEVVYGGFYKLRDCAKDHPLDVRRILKKYEESQKFDGEVAETLGDVISEVDLIVSAVSK